MGEIAGQLREWVPWSELTGTPRGTVAELRALIRKYSRSSLLTACARLGIGFQFGPEALTAADLKTTGFWARVLLPPSLIPKVIYYAQQGRPIFMQAQIRFLAAEVMRLEMLPSDGITPVPDQALGELLIRSGEALYRPLVKIEGEMEKLANYVALFLPYYELNGPSDALMNFLRFYIFSQSTFRDYPSRYAILMFLLCLKMSSAPPKALLRVHLRLHQPRDHGKTADGK